MSSRNLLVVALVVALVADAVLVSALLAGKGGRAVRDAQTAQRRAEAQLTTANARIAQLEQQLAAASATPTPSATPSASPSPSPSAGGVTTPPEGSPTRTAILAAITTRVHGSGVYVVDKMQVADGWAYSIVVPTDPNDPSKSSSKLYTLCQQPAGGGWSCLEAATEAEAQADAQQNGITFEQWLMRHYPLAPPAIFQ